MPQLSPSLRKAAVLISALDSAAADALLDQMSADEAAKVRRALVELHDIPADEQQQVLADFLRHQRPEAQVAANTADEVLLELDPQVEAAVEKWSHRPAANAEPVETGSFDFLEHVEPQSIARVLRNEHPQVAAVVISHLPPQQAAQVLEVLPADLATDALERIATLDTISPDVTRDLAHALRRQVAPHVRAAGSSTVPLAHLSAVLEAMDFRQRQRLLLQLGERNTTLLKRLGMFPSAVTTEVISREEALPRYRLDTPAVEHDVKIAGRQRQSSGQAQDVWLTFDDLEHFSDAALKAIFAAADTELSLLALTGAESHLLGRILRKVPVQEATILRQRLEHPAAVRLRDIEQARAALAAVASRLAHEGSIELPAKLGFAAAV